MTDVVPRLPVSISGRMQVSPTVITHFTASQLVQRFAEDLVYLV